MNSLLIVTLLFFSARSQPLGDLIFGGKRAYSGQWPSQVLLSMATTGGKKFICGGTLLSIRHVLTAAHCVGDLSSSSVAILNIIARDSAYSTDAQVISIASVEKHPDYVFGGNHRNDIAVVTLASDALLSVDVQVVKIAVDDRCLLPINHGAIVGFGTTLANNAPKRSSFRMYADVPIVDFGRCKMRWAEISGNEVRLTDTQICGGANGFGIGPGDSGGPFLVDFFGDWYQTGLSSFVFSGDMSQQGEYPGVFTRASKYCDFIEGATQEAFNCTAIDF